MKLPLCSIALAGLLAYAVPATAQTEPVCDNKADEKCIEGCPNDPDCPPVCIDTPKVCDPTCKDDPDCEPNGGADCSPGFYKNHVEAWCSGDPTTTTVPCPNTTQTLTCEDLVCLLSAEGGPGCGFKATATQRAFAKACLDALSSPDICEEE
jgi:hypothetical protein